MYWNIGLWVFGGKHFKKVSNQLRFPIPMSNFCLLNSRMDVVFRFVWHHCVNSSKACSSLLSRLLPGNSLNLQSSTSVDAAKSCPHPKWNECIESGKARLASSRPGTVLRATCPLFKALSHASSLIVLRQAARMLASCQSYGKTTPAPPRS